MLHPVTFAHLPIGIRERRKTHRRRSAQSWLQRHSLNPQKFIRNIPERSQGRVRR